MLNSLEILDLKFTSDFSSDESVKYLANMIAKALNLRILDISGYRGSRRVDVELNSIDKASGEPREEEQETIIILETKTER